jgi:hypothetical protein
MIDTWTKNDHTIVFDGGEVHFELWLGENTVATAPGNLVRANGTLDGTAFDVASYYQLPYRPGHHHFIRDFGVVFDSPIGAFCGLTVTGVIPEEAPPAAVVTLTDCALDAVEERSFTSQTLVIGAE